MSKNWYWKSKVVNLLVRLSIKKETKILMDSALPKMKSFFLKVRGNDELKLFWYKKLSPVIYCHASCSIIHKCGKCFI